ncbi:MAG: rod shape-determining protein RodA [Elusimicrobia bacterium RIFCSPHIGHO2_01_FULL_64_10]|nr:MAG: rod shape-determining protein RodA [Elusimicrobia bacterium RIFCSPHIGHO2_01_FULL_64_10]
MVDRAAESKDSPLQRFARHFDWVLFGDVVLLCGIGLVMVYSASLRFGNPEVYFGKQLTAFLIGMAALFVLATVNYQVFSQYPKFLFFISVSILALVLAAGTSYRGTRAWFTAGPFSFQPSEISKLLVILLLGIWCSRNIKEMRHLKSLAVPFFIVLCHIILILLQPDFGSILVYMPVLLAVLYAAGARLAHLSVLLLYGLVAAAVLLAHTALSLSARLMQGSEFWAMIYHGTEISKEFLIVQAVLGGIVLFSWWLSRQLRFRVPGIYFLSFFLIVAAGWSSASLFLNSLKEYQRKRLDVFLMPSLDPSGAGYHVIQSEVALGSGRIFGKGLFSGTQSQLGFLPEQHTDFIFSVLGEELGFVFSAFVMLLYLVLLLRAVRIAGDSRDHFGSLVAIGIAVMFAFYIFMNLAMVMGLAPITGLPLPFLSYGGSAMISSLAAVGLLLSIHVRRFTH